MKLARNILWGLFPVSIIVAVVLIKSNIVLSLLAVNIIVALIFVFPVTAMLLQTIMNKEKNLSKNYYILKMAGITYLYIMIFFMFIAGMMF